VRSEGEPDPKGFGNLMQVVDAAPYRGKRVVLRGTVRTALEGSTGHAALWLRVDRPDNKHGFFDNMVDRPIRVTEWSTFEIVGDVAEDAEDLNFGLMLVGRGKAWLDAVSLEIAGPAGAGNLGPRPFEGRGLENTVAFARLLGYVRYFHPTQAVADQDWDRFAIEGVRAVEGAADAEQLAATLQTLFAPVAPTVRVYPVGNEPELPASLRRAGEGERPAMTYWRHFGVGTDAPRSIYSSARVTSGATDADFKAAGAAASPVNLDPRPMGWKPSGNDRATRLAAVVLAWNVFQHFYPYFDVVETDWPATLRRSLGQAAVDEDEEAFLLTLRRLVADLYDGHGRVHHAGDRGLMLPPLLWDWIEDRLVVTRVGEGVDALAPGDVVVRVDGRPVTEALADLETRISSATPQWKRHRALYQLAAGPHESEIVLTVAEAGDGERTVTLKRTTPTWGEGALSETRPEKIADLGNGIVYVDLGRQRDSDFEEAVPRLAEAKGIVFDMRGYPSFNFSLVVSHLIDEPVTCAQWHVPTPSRPDREGMTFRFSNWNVYPKFPRFTEKVAFLTHGGAISAAETLMGIVEHYRLGAIVGTPTAGTNGNVNPFTLPGGYSVSFTGMKVLKHDGSRHHGVGILPTERVERTIEGVAAGRDEQLERAVELLGGERQASAAANGR
jgi:C-terminal processing protease CtpA/Prc